ncbi:hypothetical protein Bca4012_062032 [Brassica carinata]
MKKERKQKALKEKEMDNAAYKDFETSIKPYSKKALLQKGIRKKQKLEEVKLLKREADETKRNHIEE